MHGYELKKRLADVFGLATAVSFGSLYPALARLEAAGAVRVVAQPSPPPSADAVADGPPGEGRASRRRKVYGMTPGGAKMFEDLLATSQNGGEDERSFNLRLAFARHLPPEGRLGLLEQRRAVLGERLAQLAARARARRDDRYMRVLCQRQQEELSSGVCWLDQLIQQERAGEPGVGRARGQVETVPPTREGAGSRLSPGATRGKEPRLVPLASASQLQRPASGRPGLGLPHN